MRESASNALARLRGRVLPLLAVFSLVLGTLATIFFSGSSNADYFTGCGYGYSSNGSQFGYGSSYGYGYGLNNGPFSYGYGYQVCPPSTTTTTTTTTTTSSGGSSTGSSSSSNAPIPTGLPASAYGTPVTVSISTTGTTTVTVSTGTVNVDVSVPLGALPAGTTISVYPVTETSALANLIPTGSSYVTSIAVSWIAPDGTSPTATSPVTITLTDPSIKAGDVINEIVGSTLKTVGTATTDGSATVTFSSDPTFVVTAAAAGSTTTTTTPPPVPKPLRVARVFGVGVIGRVTVMRLVGTGFFGQPKVASTEPGTRAFVIHDFGKQLLMRIFTKKGAPRGWHTLTIRLANGKTCKANYFVK